MFKCSLHSTLLHIIISLFAFMPTMQAQSVHATHAGHYHSKEEQPLFIPNQNQWHENVRFRTAFDGTVNLFLEDNAFTYLLTHPEDITKIHDYHKDFQKLRNTLQVRMHAYKVHFVGAQTAQLQSRGKQQQYHNYFLGNDQNKWAPKVPLFEEVSYSNLYEGIDLKTYSEAGHFKYDFIVQPEADLSQLKLKYEGANYLALRNGELIVQTSVQTIIEGKPYAYQMIDGTEMEVACHYVIEGNEVTFAFPDGFHSNRELIIDPTVVAATLSGTAGSQNFGHSATFDNSGNIFTGGRSFGPGYPTTIGAFQLAFGGGSVDIVISKYNPDGTTLSYATYIGGNGDDLPHSIIADFNQQLYIYGTSSSSNYPTTSNAVQPNNGGNSPNGSTDIVVTILNSDGSSLVGSTYLGGQNDDGLNNSTLNSNYGDAFRGEIILDGQNNVYITSSSNSSDFPVTSGAYETTFNTVSGTFGNPAQDVVVVKLNSDLSTLFWATYIGGNEPDIGNGLRLDALGNVYITGTAGATNFPTSPSAVQATWPGGEENAFLAKLSPDGSSLLASTFWGAAGGDQHAYFIDIDEDNQVHIYGQSTSGNMLVTAGAYSNPNSPQFLSSFTDDLTSIVYSTVVGTGISSDVNFVPVAFMVDKCNHIYFSGYYATGGLPLTTDAIANAPGTFYLGVLEPLATDLSYGTYYGNADHVDGGTSRFDKAGVVYQGVCSCDFTGILNTLPGSWATNQVTTCDVGVFKIDFDIETVTAQAAAIPSTSGCAPFTVDFTYTGQDATSFFWDFDDDGATSTQMNPTHTFDLAGSYEVLLVATNVDACNMVDTFLLTIDVLDGESTLMDTSMCGNSAIFLDATTQNASYAWQDGTTGASYTVTTPGIYWVDVNINGCARRDSFIVKPASNLFLDLGENTSACDINSFDLDATTPGAVAYEWQNGSNSPTLTTTTSGNFWIEVTDSIGCIITDTIVLQFGVTPDPYIGEDTILCNETVFALGDPSSNVSYLWQDGSTDSVLTLMQSGLYWVELDNNGCKNRDSVFIDYYPPLSVNVNHTNILCHGECNGTTAATPAGGSGQGYQFEWGNGSIEDNLLDLCADTYFITVTDDAGCTGTNAATIIEPAALTSLLTTQDVECPGDRDGAIEVTAVNGGVPPYRYSFNQDTFSPINGIAFLSGGEYLVEIMDKNGCLLEEVVPIFEPPSFFIEAGEDQYLKLGEDTYLDGQILPAFGQFINWSPPDFLNCDNCPRPFLQPTQSTLYTLTVTDSLSECFLVDSVWVRVIPFQEVYIPNAFSPNNDGVNDFFTIYSNPAVETILDFKIFDRWGELLFENQNFAPNDPKLGWDGMFRGKTMKSAVFVYFVQVRFIDGTVKLFEGDVMLLR